MTIPTKEYATRRKKLLNSLKGAAGLVFAGQRDEHAESFFRPHPHFEYLTGITNEPNAILLLDPTQVTQSKQEVMFLTPRNPEKEQWDGIRSPLGSELREKTGFKTIHRTTLLEMVLLDIVSRSKSFATLMPPASTSSKVSEDLAMWQRIAERTPECNIQDMSQLIPIMRSVKSPSEIAIIQEAVDITAQGFANAMVFVQPDVNEFKVQATLEHGYAMAGGRGSAFPPIVGGGLNSTVLHYGDNDQDLVDGELVCIDSGAFFNGYGADISRTVPVSGKFSKRQKEIYEIVLKAEEAAISAVKPGVTIAQLDVIARAIIVKAGFGDYFIHGIGHHLGLETHDTCGPAIPLKIGAVITIEPGIYIPEESIGIRIEDDILVTAKGCLNVSKSIPKTVVEIEKAMRG